jgi:hypothetical protein
MPPVVRVVRSLGAFVLAALTGLVACVASIVVLIELLASVYPLLLILVPIVGTASLALVAWLTAVFYLRFSGTSKQTGASSCHGV